MIGTRSAAGASNEPLDYSLLGAVIDGCGLCGCTYVVASADTPLFEQLIRSNTSETAIVLPGGSLPGEWQRLTERGLRCVLFADDTLQPVPASLRVGFDAREGAARALSYLAGLGHERLAVVADERSFPHVHYRDQLVSMARALGFAMWESGGLLHADPYLSGLRTAEQIRRLAGPPTALVVAGYELACGVWDGLERNGWPVPQQISLLAIYGGRHATSARAFTHLRLPFDEIGLFAVRAALRKDWGPLQQDDPILFACSLEKQGTCRVVPSA